MLRCVLRGWRECRRAILDRREHLDDAHALICAHPAHAPLQARKQVLAAREKEYGAADTHAAFAGAAVVESSMAYLYTRRLPDGEFEKLLAMQPAVVLTDQFAPVDYMMADVFSRREARKVR